MGSCLPACLPATQPPTPSPLFRSCGVPHPPPTHLHAGLPLGGECIEQHRVWRSGKMFKIGAEVDGAGEGPESLRLVKLRKRGADGNPLASGWGCRCWCWLASAAWCTASNTCWRQLWRTSQRWVQPSRVSSTSGSRVRAAAGHGKHTPRLPGTAQPSLPPRLPRPWQRCKHPGHP